MAITLRINEVIAINDNAKAFTNLGAEDVCTHRSCVLCPIYYSNDDYFSKYHTRCFGSRLLYAD